MMTHGRDAHARSPRLSPNWANHTSPWQRPGVGPNAVRPYIARMMFAGKTRIYGVAKQRCFVRPRPHWARPVKGVADLEKYVRATRHATLGTQTSNPMSAPPAVLPEVDDLRNFLAEAEKTLILRTLRPTNCAQAEAARRLGISRSDLGYKIAKYGISDPVR